MTPEYIEELADRADPHKLWRLTGLEQMALPEELKCQLDTGIVLRRYADHIRRLKEAYAADVSVLITPLNASGSGTATRVVRVPPDHAKLKQR